MSPSAEPGWRNARNVGASDSNAGWWRSKCPADASLAVIPIGICVFLATISAVALFELTIERGLITSGSGVLPPVEGFGSFQFFLRFVVLPLLIGLVGALVAIMVVVCRRFSALYDLARVTSAFTRGEIEELDLVRTDAIGDVNRAFADLREELERARRAERLFLLHVSHELRTPVAAIRGQAEGLADGIFDNHDDEMESYGAIISEAERLDRLIGDLMDIARARAHAFRLERDEIEPMSLLDAAVLAVGVSAKRAGVEVRLERDALEPIIGDGDRLLQVVGNLLRNAVRWTPRGGSVRVRGEVDGDWFVVQVDDSGVGIASERREKVFATFYSESGTGSGLGLAIAREITRAMGGDITIKDAPAGGARFIVRVPCAPCPPRSDAD